MSWEHPLMFNLSNCGTFFINKAPVSLSTSTIRSFNLAARRSKFGAPMFEPEVFRKQGYCRWQKYLWYFWDFLAPSQSFGAPIVFRRPMNCAPLRSSAGGGGAGVQAHPKKIYLSKIQEKPLKIRAKSLKIRAKFLKTRAKMVPNVVWMQKTGPTFAESTWRPFLEILIKKRSSWSP